MSLPLALDATLATLDAPAGRLAYYSAGDGRPLLLIHSINAAGSAYEVKPIFDYYRASRRVVAVDLPGFGHSERSDRQYDIALYTDAVRAMVRHIDDGQGIDAVALSLSSEFLARAAGDVAALRRIALITPTGFRAGDENRRGHVMSSREVAWLSRFLSNASIGEGAFRLLTRPRVIRYFLKRTWGSQQFDQGLAHYDDATTQEPGAHHAPLAFISGRLFSQDIRTVYEALALPVFVAHGTRGDFKDFSGARWTDERNNWTRQSFDTGAFPHFEDPATFFHALDRFLS